MLNIPKEPVALTIGFFDGFHLGHQQLIETLKKEAQSAGVKAAVLTFSNHPRSLFNPEAPPELITPTAERRRLLENLKLDYLFWIPFTKEFANQTVESFLAQFTLVHLLLGHDARIGRERTGDPTHLLSLSQAGDFKLTYLAPLTIDDVILSSSKLREKIQQGNFKTASRWMGRDYSLSLPVIKGLGVGKGLGFSTANMDVTGLVLPPPGVYVTSVIVKGKPFRAVANLGTAPTVRTNSKPQLEVHIIDQTVDLTGETIEVLFHKFIREERRFDSLSALKEQIAQDTIYSRNYTNHNK